MTTLFAFLLTIAILIVVHEYGHYLAARLSGVKVLKFSVGFGKPLFSKKIGPDQTEWAIGALPFGGYVKMLDEREGEVAPEELHRTFNRASLYRRMVIVVAGPLANFLLAILVYWGLFLHGVSVMKPILGEPAEGTPAYQAGLRNGAEVASVNGKAVESFPDMQMALLEVVSVNRMTILELTNGERFVLDISGLDKGELGSNKGILGIVPYLPDFPAVIGRLEAGSVAEKSGLRAGDRILSVDGKAIENWRLFTQSIRNRPGQTTGIMFLRGGEQRDISLVPAAIQENGEMIGRIGAAPEVDPVLFDSLQTQLRYSPFSALKEAIVKTWESSIFNLKMLGRMVMGQVSWRNLSGPVSIADYAGQSAQLGWISFVNFLAVISIGLGIINLLPIPLLDGGHLMYYVVELLQGKPVSERVMEIGARAGTAIIGALVLMALYNDLLRLLNG